MTKSRGGLGRGLAALIPTGPDTTTVADTFMPEQPRDAEQRADADSADRNPADGAHAAPAPVHAAPALARATATPESRPETTRRSSPESTPNTAAASGSAERDSRADGPRPDDGHAEDVPQPGAGDPADADAPHYEEVAVAAIRPNPKNPRTVFDEDALDELAHSIKEFGLLQPVVVRPLADGYELVMGERRWRAAQRAGVDALAAIVRRTEDADLLRDALLENIHRTNLNPLEEAAAYQQLLEEFDVTHDELASRLGRSRPVISNTIRLLALPVAVQRRVAAGVLSAGHARALLALGDAGEQEELAARIVAEGLSVRGTEEAVTLMGRPTGRRTRSPRKRMSMPGVDDLATRLSDTFDTRVTVQVGQRKGKIVMEFATVDDLNRLVGLMAPTLDRQRGQPESPAPEE